jgi:hypothetical protein
MPTDLALPDFREVMIQYAVDLIDIMGTRLTEPALDWIVKNMRQRLRDGLAEREKFIDRAKAGDVLAHAILMAEFDEYTEEHCLPPHSLVEYDRWMKKHGAPNVDAVRRNGIKTYAAISGSLM